VIIDRQTSVAARGCSASSSSDVGGFPGYANFLEVMADPKHEEHGEMLEGGGVQFDFDEASIGGILVNFECHSKIWVPKPRKTKA